MTGVKSPNSTADFFRHAEVAAVIGYPLADFTLVVRVAGQLFQPGPAEFRFEDSEMLVMLFRFFAIKFPGHSSSLFQVLASVDRARMRLIAARP